MLRRAMDEAKRGMKVKILRLNGFTVKSSNAPISAVIAQYQQIKVWHLTYICAAWADQFSE